MARSKDTVLMPNGVAEYLRMPRATVYKLVQEGQVSGQKVGRHWRFHKSGGGPLAGRTWEAIQVKHE